jgi:hypothetical protein
MEWWREGKIREWREVGREKMVERREDKGMERSRKGGNGV